MIMRTACSTRAKVGTVRCWEIYKRGGRLVVKGVFWLAVGNSRWCCMIMRIVCSTRAKVGTGRCLKIKGEDVGMFCASYQLYFMTLYFKWKCFTIAMI